MRFSPHQTSNTIFTYIYIKLNPSIPSMIPRNDSFVMLFACSSQVYSNLFSIITQENCCVCLENVSWLFLRVILERESI